MQMFRNNTVYPPGLVSNLVGESWVQLILCSLTTWLTHSKKKTCDVCKHPYAFTKGTICRIALYSTVLTIMAVYAADMPSTLPPVLLIRRLAQHALFTILFGLRAVAVAVIWLAVLPWATVWTWRMYFTMGESTYVLSHIWNHSPAYLLFNKCMVDKR
jgi:E3 ubiquitin-protein ligase DOA10